jgi:uncharacterized protein
MSQARTIDGLSFAHERSRVAGQLTLAAFPRLVESDASAAEVAYEIRGGTNAEGRPSLRVLAEGSIAVACQRCLQPLPVPIAVDAELELAESLAAAEGANDAVDRVVASRRMDVAALVEDELLLALPMVALHEDCELSVEDAGSRASPFAALAALKSKGG